MNKELIIEDIINIANEIAKEATVGMNKSFQQIDLMHLLNLSKKLEQIAALIEEE